MSDEVRQQTGSSESGIVGQSTTNDRATVARQTSSTVSTRLQTGASRPNDNLAGRHVIPVNPVPHGSGQMTRFSDMGRPVCSDSLAPSVRSVCVPSTSRRSPLPFPIEVTDDDVF